MKDREGREAPGHTWAQGATPFLPNQDWPPTVAKPKWEVSNCVSFQGRKSDPISSLQVRFVQVFASVTFLNNLTLI